MISHSVILWASSSSGSIKTASAQTIRRYGGPFWFQHSSGYRDSVPCHPSKRVSTPVFLCKPAYPYWGRRYMTIAGFAVLLYDHALTVSASFFSCLGSLTPCKQLSGEIELIWKSRANPITRIFLAVSFRHPPLSDSCSEMGLLTESIFSVRYLPFPQRSAYLTLTPKGHWCMLLTYMVCFLSLLISLVTSKLDDGLFVDRLGLGPPRSLIVSILRRVTSLESRCSLALPLPVVSMALLSLRDGYSD